VSRRLILTTGDPDGIGWEVAVKALNDLGPQSRTQFIIYRSLHQKSGLKINRKFKIQPAPSLAAALADRFDPKWLIEVRSAEPPARWVEEAARAGMNRSVAGMVTAPLSKTSIVRSGLKDIGHTEILARISGHKDLYMGFLGKKFSVVLATGHEPLENAIHNLSMQKLAGALRAAAVLKGVLPPVKRKRPIALVGVNPHAGEEGLIGSQEGWFRGLMDSVKHDVGRIAGPLVPDAAFLPDNWLRYSVYVCPYHDQGLIPFKMIHGFNSGVHITLGLPFVRTSVDHGTAKDLFGKNKAQHGSMKEAIALAVKLCNLKEKSS
jgi:4-hydroxythreonine-4-phosphate dehydrogenase